MRTNVSAATSTTIGTGAWTSLETVWGAYPWRIELDHTAAKGDSFEVWASNDPGGSPSYVGGLAGTPPQGQKLGTVTGPNAVLVVQPGQAWGEVLNVALVRAAGDTEGVTAKVSGTLSTFTLSRIGITATTSPLLGTGSWTSLVALEGEYPWRIELDHTATKGDSFEVWGTNDSAGSASYGGPGLGGTPPQGQKMGTVTGPNAVLVVQPDQAWGQVLNVALVRAAGSTAEVTAIVSGMGHLS